MAPSFDGPGPVSPVLTAPEDSDMTTLSKRYEQFQLFDREKTKFMGELLARHEYLTQQRQLMVSERVRDREFVLECQNEKKQYEKWVKNMQRAIADNPFVVVLIDGDGMIFLDEFLRQGEHGGRQAASQLHAAVQEYIDNDALNVPHGARIVCRIYANVRGLGDVLVRSGAIQEIGQFEDFVRGFTRGKTLFDFIDVGAGKDRADEKIIESFKLYSRDYHCRRLLFGCSHDNGYARALEECSDRAELVNKVVLLEGVPFEKELVPLPYGTKKFPGLFRDTKINVWRPGAAFIPPQSSRPIDAKGSPIASSGLPARFPAARSPAEPTFMDSPLPSSAMLTKLPRTPSTSTLDSDGFPALKPTVMNWAAKAAAPPPPAPLAPVYKPISREEVIARNRAGQRVDPPCKDYDKVEVDRIKKIKLCNMHFLRQECPYEEKCSHLHAYRPTDDELSTLRLVARMAPCVHGSACQDIRCIYGHRCPAPPHKTHHIKGTKSCLFGDSCKFPPELHDIDTNVVKTLVIR
ncbi:hypothetical protein BDW02DRAFT_323474 [Decorospora gaudefroyi]|uniref:C3H1-type domain-containing protein n=1 Tax=Decorospora gaudefroyi TaxID=184978 RepID=A0A6A5KJW6_9PLEO|nr:hypothetical protein BDW02DRAFT_323474 [Decorospora gaudefroyi]